MTVQAITLREKRKQAIRQKIHTQACLIIQDTGLNNLTIDRVCQATGITKKTFYNYFPSRHTLLLSLCQSLLLDQNLSLVRHVCQQTTTLEQRLQHFFLRFKERFSHRGTLEKELIRFLLTNFIDHRDEGTDIHQQMLATYAELFHSDHHELAPGLDSQLCAEITVGMLNTITLDWLSDEHCPIEHRLDDLYQFINSSMISRSSVNNPGLTEPPIS
ncbi:TetR/AcrR family transcriptional regulator [Endozoicomonas montiporae]|uniref:Regulatory protein TetR n=1 Tax=Endozoicomonas montiporae CL-33 TaxID=570277 RepID=A0A142BDC3_9GAMM|nr:TetR/AcrR family transcriptional regulator [Endozoicomonas montiporae]AMO56749.1 regulatory protein TetR [Endozoicomonas montiporae CL-33]